MFCGAMVMWESLVAMVDLTTCMHQLSVHMFATPTPCRGLDSRTRCNSRSGKRISRKGEGLWLFAFSVAMTIAMKKQALKTSTAIDVMDESPRFKKLEKGCCQPSIHTVIYYLACGAHEAGSKRNRLPRPQVKAIPATRFKSIMRRNHVDTPGSV